MNKIFQGPMAGELHGFLEFKRGLGFGYGRAESALREFDRFLSGYVKKNPGWIAETDIRSSTPLQMTANSSALHILAHLAE